MIILSAIKSATDDTIHLGYRHNNIIYNMTNQNYTTPIQGVQGFLTDEMKFLNRKEALHHAISHNQVNPEDIISYSVGLDSSDIWSQINLDEERGLFMGVIVKSKD